MNKAIRACLQERMQEILTRICGFIGLLLRPIGLLNNEVREGRRLWALPSSFLDPLYKRNIVSPFPILALLQQYYLGIWEDQVTVRRGCWGYDVYRQGFLGRIGSKRFPEGSI